jgi:hypothetical protein
MGTEGGPPSTVCTYTIDEADHIIDVSDSWVEFARENGAPELSREAVVGRLLWPFIVGDETRRLYQILLATARANDTAIILPFRCDSPTVRREMRLIITPLHAGRVRLDGLLVAATPRPFLAVLDPAVPRSDVLLPICGSCRRVSVDPGDWVELEEVVVRMGLFTEPRPPALAESLCPACLTLLCGAVGGNDAA